MKRIVAITAGVICGLALALVSIPQSSTAASVPPSSNQVGSVGGGCC